MNSEVSPWSLYKTDLAFDFTTNAVKYMLRPGESTYSVYIGDASGNIYDLNGTGTSDNGTNIAVSRKTRLITELNYKNDWVFGRVQYRRLGETDLTLTFDWSNEYAETESTIRLKGPPTATTVGYYSGAYYYGGTTYYSGQLDFSSKVSHQSFSPAGKAESFTLTAYLYTDVNFQVDNIEL
jgi:hypothetical protein